MENNMATKYGEYKILSTAGSGGCGKVFVVELKGNKEKKAFILKTLREDKIIPSKIKNLLNEIYIINELNKGSTSDNIPKIYEFDEKNYQKTEETKSDENIINEEISKENNKIKERPYYVIDYFSKGELYYYIADGGFSEEHAQVIFKKIVEAIKFCHNKGICHLDIKPANIILDKNFEPVIIDFGYAAKFIDGNNNKIYFENGKGTKEYLSPDMRVKEKFDGEKCDIFSLGAVLFNLVTGNYGFLSSSPSDQYYCLIKDKKNKEYWEKVFSAGIRDDLSENFKNLYLKMVAFEPDERATIKDVLESPWLQEYNNLNQQEKTDLENGVKDEFNIRYEKIKGINNEINLADQIKAKGYDTRSDEENIIFPNDLSPKKIPNNIININHHIIINGYLEKAKFMNSLVKSINKKFDDKVSIITSNEKLQFEITFFNVEEEDNDPNEHNNNTVILVELFQYEDGLYLLDFLRTEGELPEYHKKFLKIKEIIQNLLLKKLKI